MATGGFSFGTPTTSGTSGFTFGLPSAGSTSTPGQQNAVTNLFSPATTRTSQSFTGFGFQTQTTGFSLFGQSTATTTVGGLSTPTTFSFGLKAPSTNVTATTGSSVSTPGLGFGLPTIKPSNAPSATTAGFGLGATSLASSSPAPFSFGLPTAQSQSATTQPLGGIALNLTPTVSTSTPQAVSTAQSPFTLGSGVSATLKPFGTLPSFGLPTSASSQPSQTTVSQTTSSIQSPLQSSIKLPTTSVGSFNTLSGTVGVTNTTTPFQLGSATTAPQSTSSFGTPSTTTTAAGQATSVSSTANTGFGLNSLLFKGTTTTTATTTTTGSTGLGVSTTTAVSSTASTSTSVLGTTSTSTSSVLNTASSSKTTSLTYNQLEDLINKWACELEDQERYFLDEADRINQWDQALINNGEKITTLYEKVENCKSEQLQIEKELDLIENQQKELETLLEPLERAANELPPGQLHSDYEREAIFQLANNVDLELEQLLSDLREMADQVNSSTSRLGLSIETGAVDNASKDGSAKLIKSFKQSGDESDAVQQLTRILNCHMHSLNWIHHNSQELMERLKSLETSSAP